ncbi:polyphosphate:nucleotide phosphotransferase, PPK2 family [Singulisphaera sp. GP187]|uniref:polyphosphate kinase 2 family protein n=1 Tax=Singulisphaera sp. GP187 TaxID=1882752 RepID=UPI00092B91A9|nr:polyphosphate kinase 2 family protein [Singulisphaera sp. GP187]SIO04864.1 polyphosphate:nucleotide phosphotransferase, PPK2 family [Singulisphaera sp. GP187]
MIRKDIIDLFRVPAGSTVRLKDHNPGWAQSEEMEELGKEALKERARQTLDQNLADLNQAQDLLYADDRYAVLIVLQAMDAAGKDGTIKHVMSGVNPQGCQVFSFKKPSAEELDHTFLWRYMKCLPERGRIGIFNRSYYEDVLVVKVHPELLTAQHLSAKSFGAKFWSQRYKDINAFERHLVRNGTVVLKFFLNVSKEEQKRRFLERLDRPDKHWKFSASDLAERAHWGQYMRAYSDCLAATSTKWAPWYVVPADHKWVTRAIVADVVTTTIRSLDLKYPEVTNEKREQLAEARRQLTSE